MTDIFDEIDKDLKGCGEGNLQIASSYETKSYGHIQKHTPLGKCGNYSIEFKKNIRCQKCKFKLKTHFNWCISEKEFLEKQNNSFKEIEMNHEGKLIFDLCDKNLDRISKLNEYIGKIKEALG